MKPNLYSRIQKILESARSHVARSVNTSQVCANWMIGCEIVNEEQKGKTRADYGQKLLQNLSIQITKHFGKGYSVNNLEHFRNFYLTYPHLISHAVRGKLLTNSNLIIPEKSYALSGQSWQPGELHPNLSWTHYRTLLRVSKKEARSFYEIEAIQNNWSARELERQINSLLFERLAKSKDKKGLIKLASKGQEISKPEDVFKDPVVIEFLGLPETHQLVESKLEAALLHNLQDFLLEMGKGFAFLSRQERISLDGDHFYVDLVFYHTILKCYVLIELKVGKLTHQDLGQMQLYVNYFDQERRTQGDKPTLGLLLCTDKNDAVVKYTLASNQEKKIFTSQYKLYLPSEKELSEEIKKELKEIRKLHL